MSQTTHHVQATPQDRLRAAMRALRWTMADMAQATGNSAATVRRWVNGYYEVPPGVLAWIEDLAAYVAKRPPPPKPPWPRDEERA